MLPTAPPAGLKTMSLRPGTDPGFLQALASIIHARVEAWRAGTTVGGRSTVRCFFNNQVYQLTERSVRFIPSIEIGGRTYVNVIRSDFEGTQPGTNNRMPFEIVYATSGELAEAPLRVSFRRAGGSRSNSSSTHRRHESTNDPVAALRDRARGGHLAGCTGSRACRRDCIPGKPSTAAPPSSSFEPVSPSIYPEDNGRAEQRENRRRDKRQAPVHIQQHTMPITAVKRPIPALRGRCR